MADKSPENMVALIRQNREISTLVYAALLNELDSVYAISIVLDNFGFFYGKDKRQLEVIKCLMHDWEQVRFYPVSFLVYAKVFFIVEVGSSNKIYDFIRTDVYRYR